MVKHDGTLLISTPRWVSDGHERRSLQLPPGRRANVQHRDRPNRQEGNQIMENDEPYRPALGGADPNMGWTGGAFEGLETSYQPWEPGMSGDDGYHGW
jgi:hypothetical protein